LPDGREPGDVGPAAGSVSSVVEPRIRLAPGGNGSLGDDAVALSVTAGLVLDDWQEGVLRESLLKTSGRWSAFEVGVVVSRQNGKGSLLEARELTQLFLLEDQHVIHSAHETMTALEHFYRVEQLIMGAPSLKKLVKSVRRTNGREAIWLRNGSRIEFATRTKGRGRGFSCDLLVFDEAMYLPEHTIAAAFFTVSARPDPQVWYTGSAVDQMAQEHGVTLARVRERALRQEPGLAYFEWSIDVDNPDLVDDELAKDKEAWAASNPALGVRIAESHVEAERRSVDPRTFAVERLGVGDWPPGNAKSSVIDLEKWDALRDIGSVPAGSVVFAFDVKPDRSAASIAVAGHREDGVPHLEIVDRRRGTHWIVDRLVELRTRHVTAGVVCDAAGPAGSIVQSALDNGVEVITVTAQEHAQACGQLFDAVENGALRHLGTPELLAAVKGAQKRSLGEAWAWSRKNSAVDISPLVAGTLALWGLGSVKEQDAPMLVAI
jgi:hypothetical protein